MSRIGKAPIELPKGVKVAVSGRLVTVEGPKGKLSRSIRPEISVEMADNQVVLKRENEAKHVRAFHGMERALINNMVVGVSTGFEKILDVNGVGYRADTKGKTLVLGLGYSHDIDVPMPDGITASVIRDGRAVAVKIEGIDRQLVGEVAAHIRSLRAPEPYKGKGVRYRDEQVRRKAGKTGKK